MAQFPTLDTRLTFLDVADAPAALYRLVGDHLVDAGGDDRATGTGREAETGDGLAYWVDARNAASPAVLREQAPQAAVGRLRVARAFTGYQHHELVRSLPGVVDADTDLVVAPNLASLYEDGDVPRTEAATMFEATVELLRATGEAVDAPVLVTAPGARRETQLRELADRVVDAERTRAGLAVGGESFTPDCYWHEWGFQTTIPYWVDLLDAGGATPRIDRPVAAGGDPGADATPGPGPTATGPGGEG